MLIVSISLMYDLYQRDLFCKRDFFTLLIIGTKSSRLVFPSRYSIRVSSIKMCIRDRQQQREKEQRKTTISDNELKRISSIAKTEQALALFESNFDIIKNNKSIIKNDTDLKIRVEILNQRLTDFINSLTNN